MTTLITAQAQGCATQLTSTRTYGARIDAAVYGCDVTRDFTREDWLRLSEAALDQAGIPADVATPDDALRIETARCTLLGAFAALGIGNAHVAQEMATMTLTPEDVMSVIGIMRDSRDGDRVWPALNWLRMRRAR